MSTCQCLSRRQCAYVGHVAWHTGTDWDTWQDMLKVESSTIFTRLVYSPLHGDRISRISTVYWYVYGLSTSTMPTNTTTQTSLVPETSGIQTSMINYPYYCSFIPYGPMHKGSWFTYVHTRVLLQCRLNNAYFHLTKHLLAGVCDDTTPVKTLVCLLWLFIYH